MVRQRRFPLIGDERPLPDECADILERPSLALSGHDTGSNSPAFLLCRVGSGYVAAHQEKRGPGLAQTIAFAHEDRGL
jgi:hypothetical protein